jgi:hypothetical protein
MDEPSILNVLGFMLCKTKSFPTLLGPTTRMKEEVLPVNVLKMVFFKSSLVEGLPIKFKAIYPS